MKNNNENNKKNPKFEVAGHVRNQNVKTFL